MLVFVTENSFILNRLLALFGERVTTQFMSQALGWADNIIIAMVPLGIVTIIVSAIRVGGPVWLKAIVGRAMENRTAAEVELMSSTSHEVSELWNGQKIVRVAGQALSWSSYASCHERTNRTIQLLNPQSHKTLKQPHSKLSVLKMQGGRDIWSVMVCLIRTRRS